jgi:hypothetical protein
MLSATRLTVFARTLLAAACVVALDAGRASACSPAACFQGWFLPAGGSTVPANVPALAWRLAQDLATGGLPGQGPQLKLWRVDGEKLEAVAFTLESGTAGLTWIRLSAALVPHARYRLEQVEAFEGACVTPMVEFEAGQEAPLPESLGEVVASKPGLGEIRVATTSGSCDTPLPASIATIDLDLSDDAAPWSALFIYQTKVDGDPWAPSWTLGPGDPADSIANPKTKVFAECPDRPLDSGRPIDDGAQHQGLPEGAHSVVIEARLPELDRVLMAREKAVELTCSGAAPLIDPHASSGDCSAATSLAERAHGTTLPAWCMLALIALAHARALRRSRNARGVSPVQRFAEPDPRTREPTR